MPQVVDQGRPGAVGGFFVAPQRKEHCQVVLLSIQAMDGSPCLGIDTPGVYPLVLDHLSASCHDALKLSMLVESLL